jgi:hemin uptake protein HemP
MIDKPSDRPAKGAALNKMPRTISSQEILGGDRLVIIRHEQDEYRLQVTAAGKLILTK